MNERHVSTEVTERQHNPSMATTIITCPGCRRRNTLAIHMVPLSRLSGVMNSAAVFRQSVVDMIGQDAAVEGGRDGYARAVVCTWSACSFITTDPRHIALVQRASSETTTTTNNNNTATAAKDGHAAPGDDGDDDRDDNYDATTGARVHCRARQSCDESANNVKKTSRACKSDKEVKGLIEDICTHCGISAGCAEMASELFTGLCSVSKTSCSNRRYLVAACIFNAYCTSMKVSSVPAKMRMSIGRSIDAYMPGACPTVRENGMKHIRRHLETLQRQHCNLRARQHVIPIKFQRDVAQMFNDTRTGRTLLASCFEGKDPPESEIPKVRNRIQTIIGKLEDSPHVPGSGDKATLVLCMLHHVLLRTYRERGQSAAQLLTRATESIAIEQGMSLASFRRRLDQVGHAIDQSFSSL